MGIYLIILGGVIILSGLWSVTNAFEERLPNEPSRFPLQIRGAALFIVGEVAGFGLIILGIKTMLPSSL